MPGEDLVAPRDDRVDDVVELDELTRGVEISEPIQRFERCGPVLGEVEDEELLERLPSHVESRVLNEKLLKAGPAGIGEVIAVLQQEPGPERFGIERGFTPCGSRRCGSRRTRVGPSVNQRIT